MNREQRRAAGRQARRANSMARPVPRGTRAVRTDELTPGDVVVGTAASGAYPEPRTVAALDPAPEHSKRTEAYWLTWQVGGRQVYYGDTVVHMRIASP